MSGAVEATVAQAMEQLGTQPKKPPGPSMILVTGGAGFVGSNLALRLQDEFPDDLIVVLDNFSSGSFKNLNGFRGEILVIDLGSPESVSMLSRFVGANIRAIFHQAAITDTKVDDEQKMLRANSEATKQMLELAALTHAKLVYASSSAVYGQHAAKKMKVGKNENPLNIYAFSKLAADNYVRFVLANNDNLHIVGLRYFNVYGPGEYHKGDTSSYIYQIYQQFKGNHGDVRSIDGRPRNCRIDLFEGTNNSARDWVHVDDVVEANIRALEAESSGIYNVGNGTAVTFEELIGLVGSALDLRGIECTIMNIPNPRKECYQNFTQAAMVTTTKVLGKDFKPRKPADGITQYIRWLENGEG